MNNLDLSNQILSAQEIYNRIPHGRSMSLLDGVEKWTQNEIQCWTYTHKNKDNPLLHQEKLPSSALIEYGAQAAAVHANLLSSGISNEEGTAFLGAVKSIKWSCEHVDLSTDKINIKAILELNSTTGAIYFFEASTDNSILASGKLVLIQSRQATKKY